jgi:hypothetical protein
MLAVDIDAQVIADCDEKHETKARVANDTCTCEFRFVHDGKRYLHVQLLILRGGCETIETYLHSELEGRQVDHQDMLDSLLFSRSR